MKNATKGLKLSAIAVIAVLVLLGLMLALFVFGGAADTYVADALTNGGALTFDAGHGNNGFDVRAHRSFSTLDTAYQTHGNALDGRNTRDRRTVTEVHTAREGNNGANLTVHQTINYRINFTGDLGNALRNGKASVTSITVLYGSDHWTRGNNNAQGHRLFAIKTAFTANANTTADPTANALSGQMSGNTLNRASGTASYETRTTQNSENITGRLSTTFTPDAASRATLGANGFFFVYLYGRARVDGYNIGTSRQGWSAVVIDRVSFTVEYHNVAYSYVVRTDNGASTAGGSIRDGSETGGVIANHTYNVRNGTEKTVWAVANAGFYFVNWTGGVAGNTNYNVNTQHVQAPNRAYELARSGLNVTINANFATIGSPTIPTYTYNGSAQGPTVNQTTHIAGHNTFVTYRGRGDTDFAETNQAGSANGTRPVNAGTYTARLHVWRDSWRVGFADFNFEIRKTSGALTRVWIRDFIFGQTPPALSTMLIDPAQDGDALLAVLTPGQVAIRGTVAGQAAAQIHFASRNASGTLTSEWGTAMPTLAGLYRIRATFDEMPNSQFAEHFRDFTIHKATPTVVGGNPSVSQILYGQHRTVFALSMALINPHNNAELTAVYTDGAIGGGQFGFVNVAAFETVGTHARLWSFVPADSANYNTIEHSINLTVLASAPHFVHGGGSNGDILPSTTIEFGQFLRDAGINSTDGWGYAYNRFHVGNPAWRLDLNFTWPSRGVNVTTPSGNMNNAAFRPIVADSDTYFVTFRVVSETDPGFWMPDPNYISAPVQIELRVIRFTPVLLATDVVRADEITFGDGIVTLRGADGEPLFEQGRPVKADASNLRGLARNTHIDENHLVVGYWEWDTERIYQTTKIANDLTVPSMVNAFMPQVNESGLHWVRFVPLDLNNYNIRNDQNIQLQIAAGRPRADFANAEGDKIHLEVKRSTQQGEAEDIRQTNLNVVFDEHNSPRTDFEIDVNAGSFTIILYTTALFKPTGFVGSPVGWNEREQFRFAPRQSFLDARLGGGTLVFASPVRTEWATAKGGAATTDWQLAQFSRTVWNVQLLGGIGVVSLVPMQMDSNELGFGFDSGFNYNDIELSPITIYIKQAQTSRNNLTEIIKTFGDNSFTIDADFTSNQTNYEFTLCAAASGMFSFNGNTATILRAGAGKLTIKQPGFIGAQENLAFLPISIEVDVVVNRANLTVTLGSMSIVFGYAPSLTITASGLVYGDAVNEVGNTIVDRLEGWGLVTNFNPAAPFDVGEHTLVPSGIVNDNYNISYVNGTINVTRRTVVVLVHNSTKAYGQHVDPESIMVSVCPINGFAAGQNFATLGLARPTAVFHFDLMEDVGVYSISLTSLAPTLNYNFDTSSIATMTIEARHVDFYDIKFVHPPDGNQSIILSVQLEVLGVVNGTLPQGTWFTQFIWEDDVDENIDVDDWAWWNCFEDGFPEVPGDFRFRIVWTAATGEKNYQNTTSGDFNRSLEPMIPEFTFLAQTRVFNGEGFAAREGAGFVQIVREDGAPNQPNGTLRFEYSADGVTFRTLPFANMGQYYVRVIYVPGNRDRFGSHHQDFFVCGGCGADDCEDDCYLFTITEASVNLVFSQISAVYVNNDTRFGALGAARAFGVGTQIAVQINGWFEFEYSDNGETWTNLAPNSIGNYAVRVTFRSEDGNYFDTTATFGLNNQGRPDGSAISVARRSGMLSHLVDDNANPSNISNEIKVMTVDFRNSDYAYNISNLDLRDLFAGALPANTTAPRGQISVSFRQNGFVVTPRHAGVYDIVISYVTAADCNWASGERHFSARVVINRIAPQGINLDFASRTFNGAVQSAADAILVGAGGSIVGGATFTYQYKLSTQTDAHWSPVATNAGTYDVRVTFNPPDTFDYLGAVVTFVGRLVINQANPTITMARRADFDFTGSPININAILNPLAPVQPFILVTGVAGVVPEGSVTEMRFRRHGTTQAFTSTPPSSSGSYEIEVRWMPNNLEGNFAPRWVTLTLAGGNNTAVLYIRKVAPIIRLIHDTDPTPAPMQKVYNGQPFANEYAFVYNATDPAVNQRIQVWFRPSSIEAVNPHNWSTANPRSVGAYDMRVRYNPTATDDFSEREEIFPTALIITHARLVVTPRANQSVAYTRSAVVSGILFTFTGNLYGTDTFEGSLALSSNINVGRHAIVLGTLNAGSNYIVEFVGGETFEITPRILTVSFPLAESLNLVFNDAQHVFRLLLCENTPNNTILAGDDDEINGVRIETNILGDNINVGNFVVWASLAGLSSSNYALSGVLEEISRTYTITPKTMTGNSFESRTEMFTTRLVNVGGVFVEMPVEFRLEATLEAGATVIYDSPTVFMYAGVYTVRATIFKQNHLTQIMYATLVISQRYYEIDVFTTAEELRFNGALPTLQANAWWVLTAGSMPVPVAGQVSLNAGQALQVGTHPYAWTFTPTDTLNFAAVQGTITLRVEKARFDNILSDIAGNIHNSHNASDILSTIVGNPNLGDFNISVVFVNAAGRQFTTFPTAAGTYTMVLTLEGSNNVEGFVITEVFTIDRQVNGLTYIAIGSAIALVASVSALFFVFKVRKRNKA